MKKVLTDTSFRLGSVTGRKHLKRGVNNQDAGALQFCRFMDEKYAIGVVSDGCSGDPSTRCSHTETGANLLVRFTMHRVRALLSTGVAPSNIPCLLFPEIVTYLKGIARATVGDNPTELAEFADSYLMCTLICFVASNDELICFRAGDGVMITGDSVDIVDGYRVANYPAYSVMGSGYWRKRGIEPKESFDVFRYRRLDLPCFAIASDGLAVQEQPLRVPTVMEVDRLAIHRHGLPAQAGLQSWLDRRQSWGGGFHDDCTVIASVEA